jgi:hypothetical protein
MNEKPRTQQPQLETPCPDLERADEKSMQPYREGDRRRRDIETVVVIDDHTPRLSDAQRRTAHELLLLYQSLAGEQPGRYAPQALLDTAGGLSRPTFPGRSPAPFDERKR